MTTRVCWRPIGEEEKSHLGALGRFLRATRHDAALTQAALARTAQIGERHVRDLERGTRRTRESTLGRLAAALTPSDAPPGTVDTLTAHMVAIAGPALAPESAFVERSAPVVPPTRLGTRSWSTKSITFGWSTASPSGTCATGGMGGAAGGTASPTSSELEKTDGSSSSIPISSSPCFAIALSAIRGGRFSR
ncbi:MAG: helix-turn-helix domain-containing protein [Mycobacterium leprae]